MALFYCNSLKLLDDADGCKVEGFTLLRGRK